MANCYDIKEIFLENLIDAGCDNQMIETCQLLKENKNINELLRILFSYKQTLLNELHQSENKIDCLDYLICKLQKEEF